MLGEVARETPPELAAIFAKATRSSPSDRYPSAQELVVDLRAFEEGRLVGAHAYSSLALLRRFVQRNRTWLAAALAGVLTLATVGAVSVRRIVAEHAAAEAQRAEAEQQRGLAEARSDRLELMHARARLDDNPTDTIAWLARVEPTPELVPRIREVAQRALAAGIAREVAELGVGINGAVFSARGARSPSPPSTVACCCARLIATPRPAS